MLLEVARFAIGSNCNTFYNETQIQGPIVSPILQLNGNLHRKFCLVVGRFSLSLVELHVVSRPNLKTVTMASSRNMPFLRDF